jgi:PTS system mannose-specific IIA component
MSKRLQDRKTENRGAGPSTGLVLVTHGQIGRSLLDVAEFILDQSLADVGCVSFRQSAMEHTGAAEIAQAIRTADQGQGVLVLTDIGGASPCNQVASLLQGATVDLVTGLNLAMLLRAWNYRSQPPGKLAELATEGAIRDIREYHP